MAIEIVSFPMKNGDFNHSYVTNYQRVISVFYRVIADIYFFGVTVLLKMLIKTMKKMEPLNKSPKIQTRWNLFL